MDLMTATESRASRGCAEERAPAVATLLEIPVRDRLDAAFLGHFATIHTDSLSGIFRTVREQPVEAVLVSPSLIRHDELPAVAELTRQFPDVPAVAAVSRHDWLATERLLQLGTYGVREVVDLTVPDGWNKLRNLLAENGGRTATKILGAVNAALTGATTEVRYFFEVLVHVAPRLTSVRALACELHVLPSTLMSRFFRASLPAPKAYLVTMRLLYAAALLRSPGLSIADVAYQLQYSSPQSFGR
ncbi:MAG: hypothetical protein B7Z72_11575, partial [Gemmatimonadetes bacterium 21-71-4]